jgi:hypothetical protein
MMRSPIWARSALALTFSCFLVACGGLKTSKLNLDGWVITVVADPHRVTYLPGELVAVSAEVRTGDGSVLRYPVLEWTATGATEEGEDQFRLAPYEALARITACLHVEEESVCGHRELPIDINPPTVTIETPSPGDELLASDSGGNIMVTGTIFDTNPEARLSLYVNGNRAEIAENGRFEYALPAEFGITHLVIEGSDGFHRPTQARMDVLMADGYLPPNEGTTRFDLEGAMAVRLTQKFFDRILGGSSLDTTVTPIVARDVASILELVLIYLDLSDIFGPDPLFDEDVLVLSVLGASVGDAIADIEILQNQGLRVDVNANDVFVELDGVLDLFGEIFLIQGGVETDLQGQITILLSIDGNGEITASATADMSISPIRPMFTGDHGEFFDAFVNLGTVQGAFHEIVRQQLEGDLIDGFIDVIPEILVDLLNTIGTIFADFEIELPLPPELGDPLTIRLDSRMGAMSLVAGADTGNLDVALDLSVETLSPPLHSDSRGLPQAFMAPTPPFNHVLGLQLGIRQDFVNGLLHSLWNAGLLDVEVAIGGTTAVVNPRLPPVIRMAPFNTTCSIDGIRCDAIVQLGQVEVSAIGAVSAVSFEVGAIIDFVDGAISLKLDQDPTIILWEVETAASSSLLNGFLLSFLESDILPALTELVGEELRIELPLPDSESLGLADIAPGLAGASLDIQTYGRIESTTGYLGLGADLQLVVP